MRYLSLLQAITRPLYWSCRRSRPPFFDSHIPRDLIRDFVEWALLKENLKDELKEEAKMRKSS